MTVIGLDLSSTSTGVCIDGDTDTWTTKGTPHERASFMAASAQVVCAEHRPELVVVEAIGTRFVKSALPLQAVHTLVFDRLPNERIVTVAPSQLKKFATGRGNANKAEMTAAAMRHGWQPGDTCTDDEADAYWLWVLGCALLGDWQAEPTKYRAEVVEALS